MSSTTVWTAQVITLFPEAFPGVLGCSLAGRALKDGLWSLDVVDLRQFGIGHHRHVDDTPSGGGPGMVIRPDVAAAAVEQTRPVAASERSRWPVICMSPRGKVLTHDQVRSFSRLRGLTIFCGRFEGVDQRFLDALQIREISIGDYILSGGEIAAQALIEATVRFIPRVLGNRESPLSDSFSDGLLEHPHYTRPRVWRGLTVPDVLLSGHHGRVDAWRQRESEELTRSRRPDLWSLYCNRQK